MSYAYNPKKSPLKDWHRADIVAALRKAGTSLRQLSIRNGYSSPRQLSSALDRSWPKGEEIIAGALRAGGEYPDIQPYHIWPSRYADDSKSTRRKPPLHVKSVRKN